MTSKEEQLNVIFGDAVMGGDGDIELWARKQLEPGQKLEDTTYFDFINVTYDEALSYLMKNGPGPFFKQIDYQIEGQIQDMEFDMRTTISRTDNRYEVFYTERGNKTVLGVFYSKAELMKYIAKRRMESAWLALTLQYCYKHHPDKTPQQVRNTVKLFPSESSKYK